MRVSTSLIYQLGLDSISRGQGDLVRTQQQLSLGQRLLAPADDPIASVQILQTEQAQGRNSQYSANIGASKASLGSYESSLAQVTAELQSIRTLAVNGGSGVLSDSDRAALATELEGRLQHILGIANGKDSAGHYLYAGFQVDTQPFVVSPAGANYVGDQGQVSLQVASGRELESSENGNAIFERIPTGNGTFTTTAAVSNAGTGLVSGGQVTNLAALTGHTYTLQFSVVGATTTYDILDATTSSVVSSGNAYQSGGTIGVGGLQAQISGAPANGDSFTIAPSGNQSMFKTVQDLVQTLRTPANTPSLRTRLANGLNSALQNIDQALEHVLVTRSSVGARLNELDALTADNDSRSLQYQATLSDLRDLDYNKALSDFARQQLALEAAQKSFVKVTGLTLFNLT